MSESQDLGFGMIGSGHSSKCSCDIVGIMSMDLLCGLILDLFNQVHYVSALYGVISEMSY